MKGRGLRGRPADGHFGRILVHHRGGGKRYAGRSGGRGLRCIGRCSNDGDAASGGRTVILASQCNGKAQGRQGQDIGASSQAHETPHGFGTEIEIEPVPPPPPVLVVSFFFVRK